MSFIGSADFPDPNDPSDPLHDMPRSIRSEAAPRIRPFRPAPSPSGFDEMLKDAFAKSRRHPLDPDFVPGPAQARGRFGVASRFTAALGVAAIIGVIFFMMIPRSQGSDPTSAGAPPNATEESQALLQKFVQFEKSRTNPADGAAPATPEDSKMLLQKFMQWQQKQQ